MTPEKETSEFVKKLLEELKTDKIIPSLRKEEEFVNYIYEGIQDINENNGVETDFKADLLSRRLLKLYVLYADNKRLAEFKSLYNADYAERQRYYFQTKDTSL